MPHSAQILSKDLSFGQNITLLAQTNSEKEKSGTILGDNHSIWFRILCIFSTSYFFNRTHLRFASSLGIPQTSAGSDRWNTVIPIANHSPPVPTAGPDSLRGTGRSQRESAAVLPPKPRNKRPQNKGHSTIPKTVRPGRDSGRPARSDKQRKQSTPETASTKAPGYPPLPQRAAGRFSRKSTARIPPPTKWTLPTWDKETHSMAGAKSSNRWQLPPNKAPRCQYTKVTPGGNRYNIWWRPGDTAPRPPPHSTEMPRNCSKTWRRSK